ncbi:MAG: type I methionyl aminopeptidase [Gemmataceae bacterium]
MLRRLFTKRPELKSARELALMRDAGKVVAGAHRIIREMARPGVKTIEIDQAVEEFYRIRGAIPLFKGYQGGAKVPFPACTCLSLNEQVVHGIPGQRVLKEGDILKADTACKLNGWCADAAVTLPIGEVRPEIHRLIQVAWETLNLAVVEMGRRRWWSEVAKLMQAHVERAGFSVVTQYVGHGIGRIMHEAPQVANYFSREIKKNDFRLEPGLVLAVEPMVNMRKPDVDTLRDNWTVVTRDRLPSAHVEHTLAVTEEGIKIITADEIPAAVEAVPA